MRNIAYIDNQNLYMATKHAEDPWMIDMQRFRVYLEQKYGVVEAYLFMGSFDESMKDMYELFQRFGYILVWRSHGLAMKGAKKGNVDTDVVFQMMRDSYERDDIDRIVLVSGDGDYWRTVDHLCKKEKLERVLLPSRRNASSLYKMLPEARKAYLDNEHVKRKIGRGQ